VDAAVVDGLLNVAVEVLALEPDDVDYGPSVDAAVARSYADGYGAVEVLLPEPEDVDRWHAVAVVGGWPILDVAGVDRSLLELSPVDCHCLADVGRSGCQ